MAKYSTAGATFSRSTDGVAYNQIINTQSVEISGAAKEEIESTSLEDTARTNVDGLPGFGTVNITIAWDPANAQHQALQADFAASNTSRYWKLTHPSSGTIGDKTWQGPVVSFSESIAPNGLWTKQFGIRVSGAIAEATT
jgi:hypothetical protein